MKLILSLSLMMLQRPYNDEESDSYAREILYV